MRFYIWKQVLASLYLYITATMGTLQAQQIPQSYEIVEANKTEASPNKSPLIFYWHLNLQYINDYQNGNLSLNMDDYYTYGILTLFSLNNWDMFFSYRALTDRYASKTRIDELQAGVNYTFGNLLSPELWRSNPSHYNRRPEALYDRLEPFYLGLKVSASYFQAGDILGQDIQNFMHDKSKVPKIYTRYLYGPYLKDNYHTLSLGSKLYFAYTLNLSGQQWQQTFLELGLESHVETALGYQNNLSLGLRSKLYSGNQYLQFDLYLYKLSYYQGYGQEGQIEGVWSDARTALWLAFSSRVGLYQRRLDISFGSLNNPNPDSQLIYPFGFGSLELSWAFLKNKRKFVEPDFSHSLMFGLGNSGLSLDRFAFLFRLANNIPMDFSLITVRDQYGDPDLFDGNTLARKVESSWLGMLHLRPTLNLNWFGYLEFYAGIGAGVQTMQFVNSKEMLSPRSSLQYFTLAMQTGLRWYFLTPRSDGAIYGIEAALFSLFPFSKAEDSVRFNKTGVFINNLQPRLDLMLGITVLTDW